ncbi:inactive phospholipase C-like protein 2 [Lingula anatina]|uniref:Phosphoinositide phospholipase C n=1 Tax=Lingula anatina TaxID=7574 RepID=A0A1S3JF87_LINAN|nr:inactive phospholipase C-like protein 2 [Lingula anatina]|eukprot:XP_013409003.1 inactive phospholipase C-like protein 2 [Lingula anatina]
MAEVSEGSQSPTSEKDDVFHSNGQTPRDANGTDTEAPASPLPDTDATPLPRRSSLIKDAAGRRHQRKKTVSFSSMPFEKKIANSQDCLNYMQNGSELIKVRSNSRQYHRYFSIDPDLTELRWQPSSKKPHKARIGLEAMKEVRSGKTTDVLRNKEIAGMYQEECAFSVIYGDNYDSLDLIAASPDEAGIWVAGLTCLISGKNNKSPESLEDGQEMRDRWLQEVFSSADQDNIGVLDEFEVINLMKKLDSNISTAKIQQKIKEICTARIEGKNVQLNSDEFSRLFKDMVTRPEVYFLLVRYSSHAEYMSIDDLMLFLEAEQGISTVTKEDCLRIVEKYEPSPEGRQKGQLAVDGFTAYLLSEDCDLFDPEHRKVCQDMAHPLSHYFIATSHNTYLLEDQLKGPSSTEAYERALKKGCRCLELDTWDGPDDEPVIYHGHTLTSKVSFKSVIDTINQYAFQASEYPVILAIENHCCIKLQQAMVHYMKAVFGDKLYAKPTDENAIQLPSPEELKGKILIKCKKLPLDSDNSEGWVTEEDEGAESTDNRKKNNKRPPEGAIRKYLLSKELSDLVSWCQSVRFTDFETAADEQDVWELCSFSESFALRLANSFPEEFVNHNKRFLSRVYPNGARVDSGNYNPQDMWNCGCQLVALNYQTGGLMMDLYDGKFAQNGGCGYVIKPAIMREEIAYFSANTRDVIPGVPPQVLHIRVISGHQFPKPKGSGAKGDVTDPYVLIEIFGIPADCAEERTKTVPHNGYNPLFDESFEFQVNLPELALVRFVVLDDDFIGDEFIGQYTIPFECMQTGYRHIRLLSNTSEVIPNCTLFVHIAITDKCGGGKSSKRGTSVKKNRSRMRDHCSLKTTGVKNIDDTFKSGVQSLADAADLRDGVLIALEAFKETCSQASTANLKQCIRVLSSRIQSSADQASICILKKDGWPYIENHSNIPDIIKKAVVAFDVLVAECRNLVENAVEVCQQLRDSQKAGLEMHEELNMLCQQAGLRARKLNKAMESFAWNIRVLKGQADLLMQAKQDCSDYLKQIEEAAVATGLMKPQVQNNGNTNAMVTS